MMFFWQSRAGRAAFVAFSFVAVVAILGCFPKGNSESAEPRAGSVAPLMEGWDKPVVALVLTGEQHGYLEPCGCSDKQAGGLARRADLFRYLREDRGWTPIGLDDGGLLRTDRVKREQSKVKLDAILGGLNEIGYKAIGMGYEELLFGSTELYEVFANKSSEDGFDLPFVSANVVFFGTRVEGIPPQEFRIIDAGQIKIGVTSVVTDSVKREIDLTGITRDATNVSIAPANDVLPATIKSMRAAGAELLVLLSHGPIEESKALALAYPQFQVVVTARSAEDPLRDTTMVGTTLFCEVGQKGKNAAVVGVYRTRQGLAVRHELVEIQQDYFANAPSMTEVMRRYQAELTARRDSILGASIADPEQGSFVGVDECKECHTQAYEVWAGSNHAHAYDSLISGRSNFDGEWVPRIHDPECLNCHTTGWDPQAAVRHASGFVDLETTKHLAGQQCENCHGPGSKHVAAERAIQNGAPVDAAAIALRKARKLDVATAEKTVCAKCHDYENSPHFDFDKYWEQIEHHGKD